MHKKQSNLKPENRFRSSKIMKFVVDAIKTEIEILDKALDFIDYAVGEKNAEKEKILKQISKCVLWDYEQFTSTTYLGDFELSHKNWIKNRAKYTFWVVFLEYLRVNKVNDQDRSYFYKAIFEHIENLNDANLCFLINKDLLRKERYQIKNKICQTDFIKFFRLPKNFFRN